jgi:DNA-binding transcriptional LysR family regulator
MELRHLRYFVTLAAELHFGRAAARLGISQPPLSQQIKALEDSLATRLFERTNRHVELTEAGRLFLIEAEATLAQAERARQVASRAQRGELGELRIGMFPSAPLTAPVGRAIVGFRRRFPDVRLVLSEFESGRLVQALVEGRQQIAIIRGPVTLVLPPELIAAEFFREPLVVAIWADHPLAAGKGKIPIAALANEPFVFYGPSMGSTLPTQVLALCQAAGFQPRVSQVADANATIIGLVAVGLGIAVVPAAICQFRHETVVSRELDAPAATTPVWILRHRDHSPLTRRFMELATSRVPGAA